MTHKKKDCLERPRKVGAKFSGSNFAPDERILPKLSLTFDGKRDRWNGYDNFAHTEVTYQHIIHIDTLILPAIILKIVSFHHDFSLRAALASRPAGHWLLGQLKQL